MELYSCGIEDIDAYALGVYNEDIKVGKLAKLSIDRHFRDLAKSEQEDYPYFFLSDAAEHFFEFASQCYHYKGAWAGQPFVLNPWQKFVAGSIFGWLKKEKEFSNDKWRHFRRFREAYLEVPRKNGKTFLMAVIALYLLKMDEENAAEIFCAATTRKQARIVFDAAVNIIKSSPSLRTQFEVRQTSIIYKPLLAKFEPLSRDSDKQDGFDTHGGLFDELHAWKKREQYDVIDSSTGARKQPLILSITTAGFLIGGLCYQVRATVKKILEEVVENETIFGIIYTIDEEDLDNWDDPEVIAKANPNFGDSVNPDEIQKISLKAQSDPGVKNNFLTKHLNVWLNSMDGYMDMQKWNKQKTDLTLKDFKGYPCYLSLDLASKLDLTAGRLLFRKGKNLYSFGVAFCPEKRIMEMNEGPGQAQYMVWRDKGELIEAGEAMIDQSIIFKWVIEMNKMFDVLAVGMDNYQAANLQAKLQRHKIKVVEIPFTVVNLSEPMKELRARVYAGRYWHTGDSLHTWTMSNVVCRIDAKENIFPRKEDPENKIDPAVADMFNMSLHLANPIKPRRKRQARISTIYIPK